MTTQTTTQISPTDPRLAKFKVPQIVFDKYGDLVSLIIETESMNDQERSYWFQILPIMTDEQVQRLRNILTTEKEQLAKLDKEYEGEIQKLNEKHISKWNAAKSQEQMQVVKKEEQKAESQETDAEEALISQLNNI